MSKKVILITGGSKGLGAEFVKKLASADAYIIYYTYSDPASECASTGNTIPVRCDQRNADDIAGCMKKILEEQGKIDVLVNNACPPFMPHDFLETDWSMFQDILDVNVKGAYLFSLESARAMKRQGGGRIINVLSSYVLGVPPEKLSFYVTAKYALEGLSKAMAVEFCKYGIAVNMMSPGLMTTRLTEYLPARYIEAYKQKHPMKRLTTPEDVAEVLDFLVSDGAQFLTGVNIPVTGGETF